jgi:predicted dehydrogenase
VLNTAPTVSREFALDLQLDYPDVDHFIFGEHALPDAERVKLLTVATPNHLHYEMARKLIFAVAYTYTGYPMVRRLRAMIENDAIGRIQKVDVQYYKGWINTVIHDAASRAGERSPTCYS